MKQFKIILLFVILLQLCTTFQTMAKERYRIVIRTFDGVSHYAPMVYRRNGKLLKEWVNLNDATYYTRESAIDVINRAKIDAANYEISKQIKIIYIK